MEAEILLVRHAFTPANNAGWNKQEGIRDVFKDDEHCPIDKEYGVVQAQELGNYFQNKFKDKRVAVVMSPYRRVQETISIATQGLEGIDFFVEKSLREIDQGVTYATTKERVKEIMGPEADTFYDLKKTDNSVAIEFLGGESEIDVRRRVRNVSKRIDDLAKQCDENGNLKYDIVVVASHETVNKWIYYWLNNQEALETTQLTTAVIAANGPDKGNVLHSPITLVPKGYEVNLESYGVNYFNKLIKDNEHVETYNNFCDIDLSAFVDGTIKVEKSGFDLYIPVACNNDKTGYFFINSTKGHDCHGYDKESFHSYYVLEGDGKFTINGNEIIAVKGSTVVIPPFATFYYEGSMKMILKMEPNFKEENFVVVDKVTYEDNKTR